MGRMGQMGQMYLRVSPSPRLPVFPGASAVLLFLQCARCSILRAMNRLQAILDHKRTEIARILPRLELLRAAALERNDYRGFASAIDRGPEALGLIAEVKKASPSVGTIVEQFDPVEIARAYQAAGAHAVSVLTEEKFFQGHLSYLTQVRRAIGLPVLRKDFILHEVQIYEAAVAGADAVLLIVAALEQPELERLHQTATMLGMDVLVEIHAREELDRALDCGAQIIGVNNRNLATFEVDLRATEEISEDVPEGIILVSESGIKTQADSQRVFTAGVNAILVGESLMRTGDIPGQVTALLGVE